MKNHAGFLATLGSGLAFAALAACGGGGADTDSPGYQAFMARDAFMHELGDSLLVLNEMSTEERPVDEAAFLAAAQSIATLAPQMVGHFENQTLVEESRTKPEVWQNWADFSAKADALVQASRALSTAASNGGFAAGRGLVVGVRDTCGGCHRPYRGPEKG